MTEEPQPTQLAKIELHITERDHRFPFFPEDYEPTAEEREEQDKAWQEYKGIGIHESVFYARLVHGWDLETMTQKAIESPRFLRTDRKAAGKAFDDLMDVVGYVLRIKLHATGEIDAEDINLYDFNTQNL